MSSDHPVFTRLTRAQCVVRRRNLGFQTLVFNIDDYINNNNDVNTPASITGYDNDNDEQLLGKHGDNESNESENIHPELGSENEHESEADQDSNADELHQQNLGSSQRLLSLQLASSTPTQRCKVCARWFELYWKPFLCHVCGQHICEPCSSVVEREREHNRIHFVRCCAPCLRIFNTWLPDPDELAHFCFSPWVVEPSTGASSLGLNLAEVLRSKSKWRRAGVDLLRRLGRPVGDCINAIDRVSESDWVATTVDSAEYNHRRNSQRSSHSASETESDAETPCGSSMEPRLMAQYLIQQCYEVQLSVPTVTECEFAEASGVRGYPLEMDESTGIPYPPHVPLERERLEWIKKLQLLERDVHTERIHVICRLAALELHCSAVIIMTLTEDAQVVLTLRPEGQNCLSTRRNLTAAPYMLYDSDARPFLIRNVHLDARFRRLPLAVLGTGMAFVYAVPIVFSGVPVALLTAADVKPRASVTTVEFAVMRSLADLAAAVLMDEANDSRQPQ